MPGLARIAVRFPMQITPLGDSALIVRFGDEQAIERMDEAVHAIESADIPGLIEIAPAFNSLAVFFDPAEVLRGAAASQPIRLLETAITDAMSRLAFTKKTGQPISAEIPVCYDDEFALDLTELASTASLPPAEVVRRQAAANYRVSCVGFAPGFPYLNGLPAELATPRRATPRTHVAAGSVAIGGALTGIYPRDSPGGWNVIGRTPLRLFDIERESPSLLSVGDAVRFRPINRQQFEELLR